MFIYQLVFKWLQNHRIDLRSLLLSLMMPVVRFIVVRNLTN